MNVNEIIERIDSLRKEIDSLRPISPEIENKIWQKYRLDWNFHSNNLEGNSLSFGETKSFLLHGITAEGKPLKDHLDIKGHNEAILLLDDIIKEKRPLTETFIRELHEVILHEPYERKAITADGQPTTKRIEIGKYKKSANHVQTATGEIFYFATPEETPAMMNDLIDWYQNAVEEGKLHPLIIASQFHYRFVRIHPFDDGNGRMSRIMMNLILMRYGFPPVVIKTDDKVNYFKNLQLADGGNMEAFYAYIGEQLIHSEELFLKGARGEDIQDLDDVDKEISLLKARLQTETHKIIFGPNTVKSITEDSITPLFNNIFLKLNQFDELFNKKRIDISLKRADNSFATLFSGDNSLDLINAFIAYVIKASSIQTYRFKIQWKDFVKTENKLFDVNVFFELNFRNVDFVLTIDSAGQSESQSFDVFYHKQNDQKKFQKIASELAKRILRAIEVNLED